jgi:hypothetical protein
MKFIKGLYRNITHVDKGVCQHRATNNQPCFSVHWCDDAGNHYKFFSIVSGMYDMYERLMEWKRQNESAAI